MAHCESVSETSVREDEILQRHLLQARAVMEQLDLERDRRKTGEGDPQHCEKQQLKLQELMSEEQAQLFVGSLLSRRS